MRQCAILATFILPQVPDDRGQEIDRAFDKEVPLLFDPFAVQAEHDGTRSFGGIDNIDHAFRVQRVTAVDDAVKIDDPKGGPDRVIFVIF